MIIDRSHRTWIIATIGLFLLSTFLYVIYVKNSPDGPAGGSWGGLMFGVVGSAMMLFAGLLSSRKKVPRWQIGAAKAWLKGHIYLGLLSVPLILFHSGFRFGGLLTQLLMTAFLIVTVSGIFGLILQHYLPRMMKTTIPAQAIYEQIPQACQALRESCDEAIAAACKTLFREEVEPTAESVDTTIQYDPEHELREFYLLSVRPFLSPETDKQSKLSSTSQATALFAQVTDALPESLHGALGELEEACDERRQLHSQMRIHHWLHSWLFMHVPLSMFMLVLGIAHAIWTTVIY